MAASQQSQRQVGGVNVSTLWYWGIGGLALLALADPFPNMTTAFVTIILVGLVLIHYQDYAPLLTPPKG